MNQYFVVYPRNFSNEYTVFVAENQQIADAIKKHCPNAEKITRKRAIYLGCKRPNEAQRTGEQHYGGFCSGPIPYGRRDECIETAATNTALKVQDWEKEEIQTKLYVDAVMEDFK